MILLLHVLRFLEVSFKFDTFFSQNVVSLQYAARIVDNIRVEILCSLLFSMITYFLEAYFLGLNEWKSKMNQELWLASLCFSVSRLEFKKAEEALLRRYHLRRPGMLRQCIRSTPLIGVWILLKQLRPPFRNNRSVTDVIKDQEQRTRSSVERFTASFDTIINRLCRSVSFIICDRIVVEQ